MPSMPFTTYENTHNPHVSIHKSSCGQLRKRGGVHQHNQGKYTEHATYTAALTYAQSTGLSLKICSYCGPVPTVPSLTEGVTHV
jgi:hypothetical protein